jgi:putative endonuclease
MKKYYAYILQCANNRFYHGSTNDLKRRLNEHQLGDCSTTRKRLPVKLVYFEEFPTRKEAMAREKNFKNGCMRKTTKQKLIDNFPQERLLSI